MLSATRRSAATPSPSGKYAVYTCSSYSFQSHTKATEICVLEVSTGAVTVLSRDPKASEPTWLGEGHELAWLKEGENGNTSVIIADASNPGKCYTAGTISGPVSSMKLYHIKSGMVAVAVAGQANPDGTLYNPKDVAKSHTSARVYDALFVRHWDTWIEKQRNSIFTALLQRAPSRVTNQQGRFNLLGFTNALKGTGLECPMPPYGGTDHFDIGRNGLVIVAKDPALDPALHTKCNAYFIPREDLMDMSLPNPLKIIAEGFDGSATSPVFSNDGNSFAFLQMKEDGYESDKNHIIFVHNYGEDAICTNIMEKVGSSYDFDRSPSSLLWSHDDRSLWFTAEDFGATQLFELRLKSDAAPNPLPYNLTAGSVIDIKHASATSPSIFVSANSLIDNSIYFIVDHMIHPMQMDPVWISSATNSGMTFGLNPSQVRSISWKGDKDHPVYAWVVVPSTFDASKKYPLAYFIHGGPQGAWMNQWSTRWNPALFAEQGYVVVCPNPTGSTGYGQAFTDAIKENWGGSPYIDLVKGFEYIESNLEYVDTDRAVALGASYGGYMMNWIEGHPLGKKFRALVCHDGIFSMTSQLASEEQYFPVHDMGGTLWDKREMYEKWDPSRFVQNWTTPMLVIHSELDYRLTIAEGLAMFNTLQMRGIESKFLTFSDENHWVLKYENSIVWHLVVINWINGFVGLPKIVDSQGRDGSQFVRQQRRGPRGGARMIQD